MDKKAQELIFFYETRDEEKDRMMNAEKFLKKIQLKPRPRYLQSSSVRIGVKGNEFLK